MDMMMVLFFDLEFFKFFGDVSGLLSIGIEGFDIKLMWLLRFLDFKCGFDGEYDY